MFSIKLALILYSFRKVWFHADKARAFIHSLWMTWLCCVVNSVGNLGSLLVSWDLNYYDLVLFLTCGGILLTGICLATKRHFSILNVYGPCVERKDFWESLGNSGLLAQKNLILVRDLNLTLSSGEIWGGAMIRIIFSTK